jgi:hypothetical protein
MTITIHKLTTVLEDKSRVYDLAISSGCGFEPLQFSVGSLEGADEIIAVINNHAMETLNVIEDIRYY